MKYNVIFDFESKTIEGIEANSKEEAEIKGLELINKYLEEEPTPDYWIGEVDEVKEDE